MLSFLPSWLRGSLATVFIFLNTLFWFVPLVSAAIAKLIFPIPALSKGCTIIAIGMANSWVSANSFCLRILHKIDWHVRGVEGLSPQGWYLVSSNHQTWADIPVVQHVFNRRIPMLKFFLKQELIWVPLLGACWWALDFPFMKRYTKEYLAKHPEMKGKDLETTRKACEKFKFTPVSVFNFLEGTRLTPAKHQHQQSPYQHLLRPKAGGVGFVLSAMGEQLNTMLDVTIYYPDGNFGFWGLLSGRMQRIVVDVEKITIPAEFLGRDYLEDEAFREQFQLWISDLWKRKDERIDALKLEFPAR